jgi:hypothetical protein
VFPPLAKNTVCGLQSNKWSALEEMLPETARLGSGMVAAPFPSLKRRGGCAINKKIPFLCGADGVVSKIQTKNKVRYADL